MLLNVPHDTGLLVPHIRYPTPNTIILRLINIALEQKLGKKISVKGHRVNILGLASQMVSGATSNSAVVV